MLSKNIKTSILKASVMASVMMSTSILTHSLFPTQIAQAQTLGEVTITVSSLYAYSSANWNAKVATYKSGQTFQVVEKMTVGNGSMYKLSNGRFISANPKYSSFKEGATVPNTSTPDSTTNLTLETTANLNLRTGPGTSHKLLLTIPKGTKIEYVAKPSSGWYEVKYSRKSGFVSAQYIKELSSTTTPTPTPTPPTSNPTASSSSYEITASLNMRSGDSTRHSVITVIPIGTIVEYVGTAPSGWYEIKYGGKTGFINGKYAKAVGQPQTSTPTPTPPSNEIAAATVMKNLYLRSGASYQNSILLTMPRGAKVRVIARGEEWTNVEYNGLNGYCSTDTLDFTPVPGTGSQTTPPVTPPSGNNNSESLVGNTSVSHSLTNVKGSVIIPTHMVTNYELKTKIAVNMRSEPKADSAIVLTIPSQVSMKREELMSNGWAKVTYEGKTGYINATDSYVFTVPVVWKETSSWVKLKRDTPNKPIGVSAIESALTQLGKPYQWGAEGPDDYDRDNDTRPGFDCSGLTQWAYYVSGKNIPRTTATGYNKGKQISRADIQIGDLIYFKTSNTAAPVTHVGMYMGDNMMIHASASFKQTAISEVYWKYMVTIVRH